jgi:hypothetical protein
MVKGRCRTNLDNYQFDEWPTTFAEVPKIGDRVLSSNTGNILKVHSITHYQTGGTISPEPRIIVELNK